MSVNLKKGQKVDLRKPDGGTLHRVMVGLGWDEVEQPRKWFAPKPQPIDCDATAFLCEDDKVKAVKDVVYFGNLKHESGAVMHMGDNLTGEGDGDDEQIYIDLDAVPARINKNVVCVIIYQAVERKQHFGLIQNAFARVFDVDTGKEICKFDLSENYAGKTAMICGEVYRDGNGWKFNAIGEATNDPNISSMMYRYK